MPNYRELKAWLLKSHPRHLGYPVIRYQIRRALFAKEPHERIKIVCCKVKFKIRSKWFFYGYLEDVMWNWAKEAVASKESTKCQEQ